MIDSSLFMGVRVKCWIMKDAHSNFSRRTHVGGVLYLWIKAGRFFSWAGLLVEGENSDGYV